MALEKKEKLTPLQRVRILILGRKKPNLVTRVSVGIGFAIWVYFVTWELLTLMTLSLMGSLKKSDLVYGAFNRVGSKSYGYTNTVELLTIHNLVELAAYFIALIGLILIYRRKRIGFLIYICGNVAVVAGTVLILGLKFLQYEMSYTYASLLILSTTYFAIGALWFYRWKPNKENENSYST